jgi:hypothetical protein
MHAVYDLHRRLWSAKMHGLAGHVAEEGGVGGTSAARAAAGV